MIAAGVPDFDEGSTNDNVQDKWHSDVSSTEHRYIELFLNSTAGGASEMSEFIFPAVKSIKLIRNDCSSREKHLKFILQAFVSF